MGRRLDRARNGDSGNGEYTRGGTRHETDAAVARRGDGEGDSPWRMGTGSAEAIAMKHPLSTT